MLKKSSPKRKVTRKIEVASETESVTIPFKLHPRVFAALGKDLVTNDIVAVVELVKNSYDALATRVDVRLLDSPNGPYIEVEDDGVGMTRRVVEDVWCVVATPYRKLNPESENGVRKRRSSGEKGLGRLSAARLGNILEMRTKSEMGPAIEVRVDWQALAQGDGMENCSVELRVIRKAREIPVGTRITIRELTSDWDAVDIGDLEESLGRLLSPFSSSEEFRVFITRPDAEEPETPNEINIPPFISKPKYAIRGHLDSKGTMHAKYEFTPIRSGKPRSTQHKLGWEQLEHGYHTRIKQKRKFCPFGPMEFEIRAWDVAPDDTAEIAQKYGIRKSDVRKAISSHKGISLYRDGILVLPKLEQSRDWLGLDLRRVSDVGGRVSTSQIVGFVSIKANENPKLEDTSNREGLAQNPSVDAFLSVLLSIVELLESQRALDKQERKPERKLEDLFDELTADHVIEEVELLANAGESAKDALVVVRNFGARVAQSLKSVRERFVYYSRLATIGTIAHFLVHEIRNRTMAIAGGLEYIEDKYDFKGDDEAKESIKNAKEAVKILEQLANVFSPLASRRFQRGKRDAIVEDSFKRCLHLVGGDIARYKVEVREPSSGATRASVDPGELDTIILNIVSNAIYWMSQEKSERVLELRVLTHADQARLNVEISDSGPGVPKSDIENVFLPGVTKKPAGIGMGLTVAGELVSEYGGRLGVVHPGRLSGATFLFDLPRK